MQNRIPSFAIDAGASGPTHVVRRGFSLLEMLIVVAIIGLLAALILPKLGGAFGKAATQTTRAGIENAAVAVEQFKLDNGRYPTAAEGLASLITAPQGLTTWSGPYLSKKAIPKDGWKRDLIYEENAEFGFAIRSYGADGKPGGTGEDADLSNRE